MIGRFLGAFRAELLKLRRTAVVPITILSPYLVILAFFLFTWVEGERFLASGTVSSWRWLSDAVLSAFTLLVFPLSIGLAVGHYGQVEERARGLKHLFALPVPRGRIYAAKLLAACLLTAAGFVLLALGVAGGGLLLRVLRPALGFGAPVPWGYLLGGAANAALAGLFLVSVLTWVAHLPRSRVGAVGLSLLALGLLLALRAMDGPYVAFHPWAWPGLAAEAWRRGDGTWTWPLAGVLGALLFSLVAGALLVREDVD